MHLSICEHHPCAGAIPIISSSFQSQHMIPVGNVDETPNPKETTTKVEYNNPLNKPCIAPDTLNPKTPKS